MYTNVVIGIIGTSATFLGISILILATMRFGLPMSTVKERLSEKEYDRLYDGMLFSILFGGVSILLAVIYGLIPTCLMLYFAAGLFILQVLVALCSAVRAFKPFKFWLKHGRSQP